MIQSKDDTVGRVKFICPFCDVRVSNSGASKHRQKWHVGISEEEFVSALLLKLRSGSQQFEITGGIDHTVNPTLILMTASKPKKMQHTRIVSGRSPGLKRKGT